MGSSIENCFDLLPNGEHALELLPVCKPACFANVLHDLRVVLRKQTGDDVVV